nr:hypothetical protein [Acinetobacter pittii]
MAAGPATTAAAETMAGATTAATIGATIATAIAASTACRAIMRRRAGAMAIAASRSAIR